MVPATVLGLGECICEQPRQGHCSLKGYSLLRKTDKKNR